MKHLDSPVGPFHSAHLRIARPTERLANLVAFYQDALGFEILGRFQDHDGFDGVMLGHQGAGYHLEFTNHRGHPVETVPSPEHLLVFYLPDRDVWQTAVDRIESFGITPVASFNPYWDRNGRTYEDPDGYRFVLQRGSWPVA